MSRGYVVETNWRTIKCVEVERETDACYWVDGYRRKKETTYEKLFTSWDKAHDHIVAHAERRVEGAKSRLESRERQLAEALAMTLPTT